MFKFISKLKSKHNHTIKIIAEFTNDERSTNIIARLTKHISKITYKDDLLITDFQKFQLGYRLTFNIQYTTSFFRRKNRYLKELSNLYDWILSDDENNDLSCLSSYHYSFI